jgi:iron complex outermembrane recepter protein
MNSKQKLSCAIAAILGGSAMGGNVVYAADAADTNDSEGIQEITVTAQRKTESIQDVPITIQALTGDSLKSLNVQSFNDLLRYTPNVTFSGNGPGTGNIFMRGLSAGGSGSQSQSTTAPFPNVALYLDDQSMQFPARNVDVYMVDMERVEVLEGPQGTLFGGGAQAGAVRYITNKPKIDVTEAEVNASYGLTAHGDPNASGNATINLPLIPDTLALRATIFTDHRGGYISNEPSTIQVPAYQTPADPNGNPIANNSQVLGQNQNTVDYDGIRASLLWKINDNWNVLLQQNYQNFKSDGYFNTEPVAPDGAALGHYETAAFTPAYNKDKYESTAWTVSGLFPNLPFIGDLKTVYAGSYMVRNIDAQQDYSNYMTSKHGSYYACSGAGAGYAYFRSAKPTTCYAPIGSWHDVVRNAHQSHELRASTSEENRIRGTAGVYWEKFVIDDVMNFNYMPIPQCDPANLAISAAGGPDCVAAVGPIPGFYATDPNTRVGTNTAFGEDVQRGYVQRAAFASLDVDIIPKVLTVTGGLRHYHYDEFEHGSEYYSATSTILNLPNGSVAHDGFGINLKKSEGGNIYRGNVTWHITPDAMAYYTYSEGFRPGGFNRTQTNIDGSVITQKGVAPFSTAKGTDQYLKPVGYNSDNLINNEVGFKTEWLEHRLQVNGSYYIMNWSNVQLPLFDPSHLGNTTFDINGPSYRVKGFELQLVARITEGLTVQGSGSWNSSTQTNAPCLRSSGTPAGYSKLANNPTPAGVCISQIEVGGVNEPYTNPYGVLGTSPAFSPPQMFNIRARYDFHVGDYKPFVSAGANRIGSQRNEPASFPSGTLPSSEGGCLVDGIPNTTLCKYTMPGYTTYDAAIGVAKDQWTAQFTGNNITNSYASTNISSAQFIQTNYPIRPRVLTFAIGYKF